MDRKLNRIKTALFDNGKTNKWLAEQLGKDPATVSKWCTNACQPSLDRIHEGERSAVITSIDKNTSIWQWNIIENVKK